jgi:hypothetical protein
LWAAKDINKEIFPVAGGKYLLPKTVPNWVENDSLVTKRLKRRCGSDSQETAVLKVSTHWFVSQDTGSCIWSEVLQVRMSHDARKPK